MPPVHRPADLPDFARPPVTEVVLSIQFANIEAFKSVHIGLLWKKLQAEYPVVTEHPPIAPAFETFGTEPQLTVQQPPFEMFLAPAMPRYWFERPDGALIQVQKDRVLYNWRQLQGSEEYPRYEAVRGELSKTVEVFRKFLAEEKLGNFEPNQCEATYVNTITLPDRANPHDNLHRITPLWSGKTSEKDLGQPEHLKIEGRYVLHSKGRPIGRLYASFQPAIILATKTNAIKLELTARGKPDKANADDAFDLLDRHRASIVRTFAAITTPEMHAFWGRRDGTK